MPSLKAIRKRISSVKNTQKITKAMKMMAAARLRRAQDSVFAIRPYARRMKKVAEDLAAQVDDELSFAEADTEQTEGEAGRALQPILLLRGQKEARIRVVAVTSDRGLAGAFSSNVCRRAERFVVERRGAEIGLDVMGRKGRDILRRRGVKIVSD